MVESTPSIGPPTLLGSLHPPRGTNRGRTDPPPRPTLQRLSSLGSSLELRRCNGDEGFGDWTQEMDV